MTLWLRRRAGHLRERMDDPTCDPKEVRATYAHFGTVNRMVSGWAALYRRCLRPRMRPGRTYRLLDVGFGGGDIPRALLRWAQRDGLQLYVTAIDPDARGGLCACAAPRTQVVVRADRYGSVAAARRAL